MHIAETRDASQYRHIETRWLNVVQATHYTGQSEYEIRKATESDPLTGRPTLQHVRIGGRGKIAFTREMLDEWMLRGLQGDGHEPDMMKG